MTETMPRMWDGSPLGAGVLSLAVVTAGGPAPAGMPTPVVAAVSDGRVDRVVPPALIGRFVGHHAMARLVCHDAGVMHRALHDHLGGAGEADAQQSLWQFVADGRLFDVGLLDQLLQLAEDGNRRPAVRSLKELARHYADITLLEESAVRELVVEAAAAGPEYAHPALAAEVVYRADAVWKIGAALWNRLHSSGLVSAGTGDVSRFGPLSLSLQVKGAVALAHARHDGLRLAPGASGRVLAGCLETQRRCVASLLRDKACRAWLKTTQNREPRWTVEGTLQVRTRKFEAWLRESLDSLKGLHRTDLALPRYVQGRLSAAPEDWGLLARCHPLLRSLTDLVAAGAAARSLPESEDSPLRPGYEVLPEIRSRGPDLEALRRLGGPGLFRPSDGHRFLTVELRQLELRALAAFCRNGLGVSRMADLFVAGEDPVRHAAEALSVRSPDQAGALLAGGPSPHPGWGAVAGALLKIAPAGLSEECVHEYLRAETGWDRGLVEVTRLHGLLVREVFPELSVFLRDDTAEVLAANLGSPAHEVAQAMPALQPPDGPTLPQLRAWVRDGCRGLPPKRREGLSIFLRLRNRNAKLVEPLRWGALDERVYAALFCRPVTALSGRVRGRMLFSEARQAAYRDSADDAAKAALSALAAAGHRVVAFAADTVLIEAPIPTGPGPEAEIRESAVELARRAVQEVFGTVPAVCTAAWTDSW